MECNTENILMPDPFFKNVPVIPLKSNKLNFPINFASHPRTISDQVFILLTSNSYQKVSIGETFTESLYPNLKKKFLIKNQLL